MRPAVCTVGQIGVCFSWKIGLAAVIIYGKECTGCRVDSEPGKELVAFSSLRNTLGFRPVFTVIITKGKVNFTAKFLVLIAPSHINAAIKWTVYTVVDNGYGHAVATVKPSVTLCPTGFLTRDGPSFPALSVLNAHPNALIKCPAYVDFIFYSICGHSTLSGSVIVNAVS